MNDIAVRRIEKTILEVMGQRYPGAKFDRDMRADFRAMAVAIAKSAPVFKAAQQAESDPAVTPDCAGAGTLSSSMTGPPDPRGPFFSTQWEREDWERRQRGEPETGPASSSVTSKDSA